LRGLRLTPTALPLDRPSLYGGDPSIDEAVRPILESLRARLGTYPHALWLRLVQAIEEVVSFAQYVRDTLPPYTLCSEDGGLGQGASEDDLQSDLFRWLRQCFGQGAVYELARVGGGRPDTGLSFAEGVFPIEVKAEYRSIDRADVHDHYLTQANDYAAARQRVSLLVV